MSNVVDFMSRVPAPRHQRAVEVTSLVSKDHYFFYGKQDFSLADLKSDLDSLNGVVQRMMSGELSAAEMTFGGVVFRLKN